MERGTLNDVSSLTNQTRPAIVAPKIDENLMNVINPGPTEPDMGAVYILLGSMAVSGLVIVFLIIYCTVHCWRKKCFKRGLTNRRRRTPRIRVSTDTDNGMECLKHTRMNGQSPDDLTLLNDRCHVNRSSISKTISESDLDGDVLRRTTSPGYNNNAVPGVRVVSMIGEKNGGESQNVVVTSLNTPPPPPRLMVNGKAGGGSTHCLKSHASESNLATISVDPDIDDDLDKKSMTLHYDLRYCDAGGTLCGFLTFALRYDHIHRVLMLHVIRARDLINKIGSPVHAPYTKVYLLPERRYHCKTRISKDTSNPEVNEMFSFDVPYSLMSSRMLQFTVYDFDRFKRHDLVGNVIMRDLFEKSDLFMWTEYTMQIISNHEKDEYGDVLFYTTYDKKEEKFFITVAKAYNLRPMDITGASDPYVKIIQVANKRRIRAKKTSMKRANLHPVYNETLMFDLDKSLTNCTDFLIKVMDWDRVGRNDLLGCCVIGPESPTEEGREQWRLTLGAQDAEKPVGMWHSLLAEIPENYTKLSKRK